MSDAIDTIDTSAEAVEAIAKRLKRDIDWRPGSLCEQAATALRALLIERDAAQHEANCGRQAEAEADAERDAALAEAARLREEVASLRLTLGGRTFDASVPEPIGCPVPGACQTVAEIVRLREALEFYADTFCELGTAHDCCGKLDTEHCSGCLARAALAKEAGHG